PSSSSPTSPTLKPTSDSGAPSEPTSPPPSSKRNGPKTKKKRNRQASGRFATGSKIWQRPEPRSGLGLRAGEQRDLTLPARSTWHIWTTVGVACLVVTAVYGGIMMWAVNRDLQSRPINDIKNTDRDRFGAEFKGHTDAVESIALTPDGTLAVTGGLDNT